MKERNFEVENREAKFVIDNSLMNTERYKRVPISKIDVRKEYGCWDLIIAYEGLKKADGVIILRFKDNTNFTPGEDAYIRTDITANFLLMNKKVMEKLELYIKNIVERLKEEPKEKKKNLEKLSFDL